jgi:hypothetical protein
MLALMNDRGRESSSHGESWGAMRNRARGCPLGGCVGRVLSRSCEPWVGAVTTHLYTSLKDGKMGLTW